MDFSQRLSNLWTALTKAAIAVASIFVFFAIMLLATKVFAQDGGTLPTLADDPFKAVTATAEAAAKGDWWMTASAVVSLLTWALRAGVLRRLGKVGEWLYSNPVAALATPLVLSAILGVVTEFANGTPFSWSTFVSVTLKVGAGAIAGFIGVKKIEEASQAGKLARAGITTQQEALDELAKKVIAAPSAPPAPPRDPPVA